MHGIWGLLPSLDFRESSRLSSVIVSRNESFSQGSEEPFPETTTEDERTQMRRRRMERLGQVEQRMEAETGTTPRAAQIPSWSGPQDRGLDDPREAARLRREAREIDRPQQEAYEAGVEEGKAQVTHQEVKKAVKAQRQVKAGARNAMAQVKQMQRLARIARGKRR